MSVTERLLKRFEGNISQSLGVRPEPGNESETGREETDRPREAGGPSAGRLRARALGIMDIRNITPDPEQPRKDFDEEALRHLTESLKKFGQLLPVRVRWEESLNKWVIISGERRYRAALAAGMPALTCHFVEQDLTDSQILEEQVVENCLREDLRPVEQGRAFRSLMEANAWSARKVAAELHVASSTVVKALALLKLPEAIQEQVDSGAIPATAAYELARIEEPQTQEAIAGRIAAEGLSREQAIGLVRKASGRGRERRRRGWREADEGLSSRPAANGPVVAITDRYSHKTEEHSLLVYSLASGVKLTVTTSRSATGTEVIAALSAALEDMRERLGRTLDETSPWLENPVLR